MSVMKRLSGIVQAKANKALDKAENPADMLDLTYSKQLENLQKVRRALADVATAKKRLELQANELKTQADKLQSQAKQALSQGNEDLAREALSRRAAIGEHNFECQHETGEFAARGDLGQRAGLRARVGAHPEFDLVGSLWAGRSGLRIKFDGEFGAFQF